MNFLGAIALSMTDKMNRRIQDRTGLNHALSAALIQIGMNPGESLAGLRRLIGLSQPNTSRVVDQLVAGGLVTRKRSAGGDSRYTVLNLTRAGTRMMETAIETRYDVLENALIDLDAPERDTLETLLEKILPYAVDSLEDSDVICRLCDYEGCPQDRCTADRCFHDSGGAETT